MRSRGIPEPAPPGKRRRADFDFKTKLRAEVPGARITVWYEEEHNGRKMDVPYQGIVNSSDPREVNHLYTTLLLLYRNRAI